jgi:hypothetical protein
MLKTEDIKQVFFHCNHTDPNGHYADEVDIIEFGQKIAAFALAQKKPMTEGEVVDFMMNIKLTENGDALLDRVKALVRSVEEFHGIKKTPV